MSTTLDQEYHKHQAIQQRMVAIAKQLLDSKRKLQQEIRDDMQNPEVQAAVAELKKRTLDRAKKGI